MIKAKCIAKNRNSKGVIVSYTLQDVNGATMNVTGQQIKQAIAKGQIDIVNLQIDRAGRLIDKSIETNTKQLNNESDKIKTLELLIGFISSIKNQINFGEFNEFICNYHYKNFSDRINCIDKYNIIRSKINCTHSISNEDFINLCTNYWFGNLKEIYIQIYDDWNTQNIEELIEEGDCTKAEAERLIKEDQRQWKINKAKLDGIIKKYENLGLKINYKINDFDWLYIYGVSLNK